MRCVRVFSIFAVAAWSATQAAGQVRAPVESDDSFRLRESMEAQDQKERILQKREHVMGVTDQQEPSGAPIQRREAGPGGQLVIIQDKLMKLQEDRAIAVKEGKPVDAIDAEIARLQGELGVLQPGFAPPAPPR